ncbi:MAG: hypothetical protein HY816_09715 [Candidatus Wallbacteria bacterium]|nr:hypothetical protein [Candidatus Wallbacteria bacterium]
MKAQNIPHVARQWRGVAVLALLVSNSAMPALSQEPGFDDVALVSSRGGQSPRVAVLTLDREALFNRLMAQERSEHSNASHLSFLDRGLRSSPFRADAASISVQLASPAGRENAKGEEMPARGRMPRVIEGSTLAGLHPVIKSACVVSASVGPEGLRARWSGRDATVNTQYWSATKILQAFNLVSLVNARRPGVPLDDMVVRPAGGGSPTIRVSDLLQDIVSYDAGPGRSNAGAETLGRFFLREQRQAALRALTGHAVQFAGAYGGGSLIARPELATRSGEVIARAPASVGVPGPNLISAYDLTRVLAMAAWHPHLEESARLPDAQWHSVQTVLQAMGHDSARYLDVAIQSLGLKGKIAAPVLASKLGFGVSSASGITELTYTAVIQFTDLRHSNRPVRRACFSLKGVHSNAVELDARIAVEVTEIVRLLANERL